MNAVLKYILFLIPGLIVTYSQTENDILARIDAQPLVKMEVGIQVAPIRATLFSWKELPEEQLHDSISRIYYTAIQKAIDIKVQKNIAVKMGLLPSSDYSTFYRMWQQENLRRMKAKANGSVVYGPIEFSEYAFYEYQFSQLLLQLKDSLSRTTFDLSESRLVNCYDSLRENYFHLQDTLKLIRVSVSTTNADTLFSIQHYFNTQHDTGTIRSLYGCDVKSISLGWNSVSEYFSEDQEISNKIYRLEKGKATAWQREGNCSFFWAYLERKSGGYFSYNEVRSRVRSILIDQQYAEYISEKKKNAKIAIDTIVVKKQISKLAEQVVSGG